MSEQTTDLTMLAPPPADPAKPATPTESAPTGDTVPRDTVPRIAATQPATASAGAQPVRLPAYISEGPASSLTGAVRRRRRLGDSGRIPALRFNRRADSMPAQEAKPAITYDPRIVPSYLRFTRFVIALTLLAAAWGGSLLVVILAEALADGFPHQPSLTIRFALYLLAAAGILWLGVITLGLILLGAYAFALALTRRGW